MRSDNFVLDTHAWKSYVDGSGLSPKVAKRIDVARSAGTLHVAAMTIWEVALLIHHGRIKINGPTMQWVLDAIAASGVVVHPLEPAISVDSVELPVFHGDPVDRIIVSTARHLRATLVTKDAKILDWAAETKGVRVLEP
jgi:PIN domain nuclease of toxin-antitoxin system